MQILIKVNNTKDGQCYVKGRKCELIRKNTANIKKKSLKMLLVNIYGI